MNYLFICYYDIYHSFTFVWFSAVTVFINIYIHLFIRLCGLIYKVHGILLSLRTYNYCFFKSVIYFIDNFYLLYFPYFIMRLIYLQGILFCTLCAFPMFVHYM